MNGTPIHLKASNLVEETSERTLDETHSTTEPSPMMRKMERCIRNPLFLKCINLIPNAHIHKGHGEEECMDEASQRFHLAFLRWDDPICNKCWKKGNGVCLRRCSCCGLVTYCSEACQKAEWKAHREYVKHLPDTPVPWLEDPFTPVIYELPNKVTKKKFSFDGPSLNAPGDNMRLTVHMNERD